MLYKIRNRLIDNTLFKLNFNVPKSIGTWAKLYLYTYKKLGRLGYQKNENSLGQWADHV